MKKILIIMLAALFVRRDWPDAEPGKRHPLLAGHGGQCLDGGTGKKTWRRARAERRPERRGEGIAGTWNLYAGYDQKRRVGLCQS